jgi:rhodanese-related sulfurtransferase
MTFRSIPPTEAKSLIDRGGCTVLDVRTPAEYAGGHVPEAINRPLDRLDPASIPTLRGTGPLLVICQSGVRSRTACERLVAAGIADAIDIAGGTAGWKAAGLPTVGTGRAPFGVDRQVRCVIGGGVLAGAVLALTVHPYWVGLSAFFGAGLLMAGITGACPLAIAIAAMPWNRSALPMPPGGSCCEPAKG